MISRLVLVSSLLIISVLASATEGPTKPYSEVSSFIDNDFKLKVLLERLDMDIKLRLLSKTFMRAFDEMCSEKLLLLDPRIKYLIQDEDGKEIISPLASFLPKSVPILKLYTSYLNLVYPLDKESFDEKFPVLQIPENATADTIINLRREQRLIASRRSAEMLRTAIQLEYSDSPHHTHPPMRLFYLYRLLMATFSEQTFINVLIKSIQFPLRKLLKFAASGEMSTPNCIEILSLFSIDSMPHLIFNAIETDIPEIVEAILCNPKNNIRILRNRKSIEFRKPMHEAAIKGNVDIINLLIERGFSAIGEGFGHFRPIHFAAMHGNYDTVVKLFEFETDVFFNPQDTDNRPCPIVLAAQKGHIDIVRFFVAHATVDLTEDHETSRLLIEVALQTKNAELRNFLCSIMMT